MVEDQPKEARPAVSFHESAELDAGGEGGRAALGRPAWKDNRGEGARFRRAQRRGLGPDTSRPQGDRLLEVPDKHVRKRPFEAIPIANSGLWLFSKNQTGGDVGGTSRI